MTVQEAKKAGIKVIGVLRGDLEPFGADMHTDDLLKNLMVDFDIPLILVVGTSLGTFSGFLSIRRKGHPL